MLSRFLEFIESQKLFESDQKILLAVSGGIDSVAMAHLFFMAGFDFEIAHCNFQLRGTESDEDCLFVKKLASQFQKQFYTVNFDTNIYASERNISIQMAAREMRYQWFDKIAQENNCETTAVAHNRDDIVETMLINLTRGTGLKGLTGIKPKMGNIIRPLLFATRTEISSFVSSQKIVFREDSSNNSLKYHRNVIRHKIIPLFKELNPSFSDTLIHEAEIFNSVNIIYQQEISVIRKAITVKEFPMVILSIPKIMSLRLSVPVLYDLLSIYGFSYTTIRDIYNSIESQSGKKFYSNEFILLKDRKTLIIEKLIKSNNDECYLIEDSCSEIDLPLKMRFKRIRRNVNFHIPTSTDTIALDHDNLKFPLILRRWKKGDYFYPLGLNGRKKLSDYFANEKIDGFEKQKIWILTSGPDIVWIVGRKIDDRFKIKQETENILSITLIY